jgi:hypothetical protein
MAGQAQSHTKPMPCIAVAGLPALSPMANVLADRPSDSGQVAVRSRFRDGADMTIVDAQFPICRYIQYTSFCRFRECTYALMRANPGRGCKCG